MNKPLDLLDLSIQCQPIHWRCDQLPIYLTPVALTPSRLRCVMNDKVVGRSGPTSSPTSSHSVIVNSITTTKEGGKKRTAQVPVREGWIQRGNTGLYLYQRVDDTWVSSPDDGDYVRYVEVGALRYGGRTTRVALRDENNTLRPTTTVRNGEGFRREDIVILPSRMNTEKGESYDLVELWVHYETKNTKKRRREMSTRESSKVAV